MLRQQGVTFRQNTAGCYECVLERPVPLRPSYVAPGCYPGDCIVPRIAVHMPRSTPHGCRQAPALQSHPGSLGRSALSKPGRHFFAESEFPRLIKTLYAWLLKTWRRTVKLKYGTVVGSASPVQSSPVQSSHDRRQSFNLRIGRERTLGPCAGVLPLGVRS